VFLLSCQAQDSSFKAGQQFSNQHQQLKPSNPNKVPGYSGINPGETSYYRGDMQAAATSKFYSSQVGQDFLAVQAGREQYDLDPNTDPVFKEADKVIANPLRVLKSTEEVSPAKLSKTTKRYQCQEARESFTKRCQITRQLYAQQQPIKKLSLVSRIIVCSGYYSVNEIICPPGSEIISLSGKQATRVPSMFLTCNGIHIDAAGKLRFSGVSGSGVLYRIAAGSGGFSVHISVEFRPPATVHTPVTSNCAALEKLADQNVCFVERETVDGPGSKTSNGVEVKRDWWLKDRTYTCEYLENPPHSCDHLKARGCVQVASRCIKQILDKCVLYEQTYECTTSTQANARVKLTGGVPFCLDGACVEQAWVPNQDMAEALSKLLVFKEMQKDMNAKAGHVFTGQAHRCHRDCVSFNNCCRKFKGWGQSIGLTRCSAAEKGLAQLRDKRRCILVGTYCAKKVLGVCLRKQTSFCCFGTKLARIVHEQGRRQLGLDYGSAKYPSCRGLTISELTRIDFSKIDLSELFADIKITPPSASRLTRQLKSSIAKQIANKRSLDEDL
jgi:type-F conjugative transfer system mating-pair stabilization protein TraN